MSLYTMLNPDPIYRGTLVHHLRVFNYIYIYMCISPSQQTLFGHFQYEMLTRGAGALDPQLYVWRVNVSW